MAKDKISIINLGIGNLFSLVNAFQEVGASACLASNLAEISSSNKIVLPGVGAYGAAMGMLLESGIADLIKKKIGDGVPVLGICLGMQLLFDNSEEFGIHQGLGIIRGRVAPLKINNEDLKVLKIPHMGWSDLHLKNTLSQKNILLNEISKKDTFYFAHSYHVILKDPSHCLATVDYGNNQLVAAVNDKNIYGCQFHPEKSGLSGLKILKNFSNL